MRIKHVIAKPAYNRENPQPLKEAIARVAPEAKKVTVLIHKTDGTPCYYPFCTKEHDTYAAHYVRKSIQLGVEL